MKSFQFPLASVPLPEKLEKADGLAAKLAAGVAVSARK
jgi:hypothetical protein